MGDALIAVRTIHFASVATLAGLMMFLQFVGGPSFLRAGADERTGVAELNRQFKWIAWTALCLAVTTGAAWLVLLASRISGQTFTAAIVENTVWTVLIETHFGEDWLGRLAVAALLALLLMRFDGARGWRTRRESAIAVVLGVAFIATLAWAGHGGAGTGTAGMIEAAGDALHLVAAGGWAGGLVPFAIVMARAFKVRDQASVSIAAEVTVRFSTFGIFIVATLVATGILNSWFLVGSLPHLVGTTYGQLLLVKVGLFIAMVSIAAVNRLELMPRLLRPVTQADGVLRRLKRNGLIELVLAFIIFAIVGALGTMPPAAHTQPTWPFPARLSLEAFADPARRLAVAVAMAATIIGVGSIVGGVMIKRLRWPLLAIGALLLLWFGPRLSLLTAEAFPTSFYTSPTGYSAQSIATGENLYSQHCASCHGPQAHGDGPAAKDLHPPPADLTADYIYERRDGDLFWWISNGIGDAMPPFGGVFDETARWNLIDFIHANADASRLAHAFDRAYSTPRFGLACGDGSSPSVEDLRGRLVHLLVAGPQAAPRLRQLAAMRAERGVETAVIALDPTLAKGVPFCSTTDSDVAKVFAIYRGVNVDQLDATEFLIDVSGWLRSMWYPGLRPDWTEAQAFGDEVARIRESHVATGQPSASHVHLHER